MSSPNAAFRLGHEVSGPIFTPFCDWIVEEANKAQLSHLLFLARDGQLLKKITDLRHQNLGTIKTHYSYSGSRASWYQCTPHIVPVEVLKFRIRTEYHNLRKTCEALGVDPSPVSAKLNLAPDNKLSERDQNVVARYFSSPDGRKALATLSKPNRQLLFEYLEQLGIRGNQNIGIIDVGWNGNYQTSLELVLEPHNIKVHGFYFGLNRPPYGSIRKGFFYGPDEYPNWLGFYPCLMESLTPANHPAVSRLVRKGHQIIPEFSGKPLSQIETIEKIHDGALSFAAGAPVKCPLFNLRRFIENPPDFASDVLSEFYFQKPFSPESEESFIQVHNLRDAATLAFSFRRRLDDWHWPQANLQKSGLSWLSIGQTTRFMIGFRMKRLLDQMHNRFSLSLTIASTFITDWLDFEQYQVISFDIFDTLLFRRCGDYFKIFEELERQTNFEGLAHMRKQAETDLLLRLRREVTLDEIYECLEKSTPDANWSQIKALELEIENTNLQPSARGKRNLEKARASGARIVFITDMYLREDWIRDQLIRHKLWEEDDMLFVSGEIGANKRSGELFKIIKDELQEATWKHYGDNLVSDVASAQRAGVRAKWLPHSYFASISQHYRRFFRV